MHSKRPSFIRAFGKLEVGYERFYCTIYRDPHVIEVPLLTGGPATQIVHKISGDFHCEYYYLAVHII